MKTVLITGCSSGFGHETAKFFLEKGWKVIATMRNPKEDLFPHHDNLRLLKLDVTNEESIRRAISEAGPIDALVNNAGIGLLNAVEGSTIEAIRDIFETNTIGTIAMTQAVLPQFRAKKAGVIVNVTSTVTLKALPLLAVYTASKSAINAFTESVALELAPFGVRMRTVLPGLAPSTKFAENAFGKMAPVPEAYKPTFDAVVAGFENPGPVTHARDVAEAVYVAVTDSTSPMKIPAGADAVMLAKEVL
jgi:NAD(P)-dependent dehydrogenase (short-subunit alcohol dehydrogenase family)